jgi:hypothetical protein
LKSGYFGFTYNQKSKCNNQSAVAARDIRTRKARTTSNHTPFLQRELWMWQISFPFYLLCPVIPPLRRIQEELPPKLLNKKFLTCKFVNKLHPSKDIFFLSECS